MGYEDEQREEKSKTREMERKIKDLEQNNEREKIVETAKIFEVE